MSVIATPEPQRWQTVHKVSAAVLIALTLLCSLLIYETWTVDWPTYPTPVVRAPIIETVMFPVVVTSTPTYTPTLTGWSKTATALPTRTVRPWIPTSTATAVWLWDEQTSSYVESE